MQMKNCLITAALAAFFLLPFSGQTAFAAELGIEDVTEVEVSAEDMDDTGEYADAPEASEADADAPESDEADADETAVVLETDGPETVELPPHPPGTATVIDYDTDPDGRLFYTIMTPDEHVFYLVIDKSSNTDNVYFLNAVTIADLAALAELPLPTQSGAATPAPPAAEPQPVEPPTIEEEAQEGGNKGMYIFIAVIAALGGGAGWYFKIYRPKQQGAASGDEYDPSMDSGENDYSDEWGDDADEANDADGATPWDEAGEVEGDE